MIDPESSPSAGWFEVREIVVDPTPEHPETSISRMGEARISAYATEAAT